MLSRCGHGCLVVILLATLAWSAEVPWRSAEYFHQATNEPLVDLLRQFASDQGLPIVFSEKVTGAVSGRFGPVEPGQFLDQLTQSNGLVWYYDGHMLYVYRSDEMINKLLAVAATTPEEMLTTLEGLGVLTDKFHVRALADQNLLHIIGPPRYIDFISSLVQTIDQNNQTQASVEIVVEVFPLKYASADDQSFAFGDSQVIVPGVVTILRNVLSSRPTPGGLSGRQYQSTVTNSLPSLRGRGLLNPEYRAWERAQQASVDAQIAAAEANATASAAQQTARAATAAPEGPKANGATSGAPLVAPAIEGVIESDPRLNAIIVRDAKEKLPYYARIIKELDRPGGLVQIEATIIDVDANSGFDWGMPYLAQWNRNGNLHSAQLSLDANTADPLAAANMGVTVLKNGATQFLARLRAMETDGHARVVSRPSVLTINNVEAQLESIDTFFVRVEGNQEVDLFNVSVGTTLRIVPHIIDDPTGRRVKLIVRIEDGRQKEDKVDDIPIITRNVLNTQAVLGEGESLLVGGLIREEQSKNEKRVPVLGRIPKVGFLFTTIDDEKRKLERLVLITPTIMDVPECIIDEEGMLEPEAGDSLSNESGTNGSERLPPQRPVPALTRPDTDDYLPPVPSESPEAATPRDITLDVTQTSNAAPSALAAPDSPAIANVPFSLDPRKLFRGKQSEKQIANASGEQVGTSPNVTRMSHIEPITGQTPIKRLPTVDSSLPPPNKKRLWNRK